MDKFIFFPIASKEISESEDTVILIFGFLTKVADLIVSKIFYASLNLIGPYLRGALKRATDSCLEIILFNSAFCL
jgi:hypothetical protein